MINLTVVQFLTHQQVVRNKF